MRIYPDLVSQRFEIAIEHLGKEIRFCARAFLRESFTQEGIDVFEPLNTYWSRKSAEEAQAMFNIYCEIYRGFDQILSDDEIYEHLSKQITLLMHYHITQDIETWVSMTPSFIIPGDIMDSFIADEENKNSPDKTYLRKDYIELISLGIIMRALMPVFGEYIESTRREVGIDFKEFHAVQLLTNTGILEYRSVNKLLSYIGLLTKGKDEGRNRNTERILDGSSTLDMDFYLLSLVLVRKLCISDIRGVGPKANLISQIYNFLYPKVFNPPKTKIPIRDKNFGGGDDDSGKDNRSILETYRKRTEISLADIAALELSYENVYLNAQRLCPQITKEEIDGCLKTSEDLYHERIGDAQITIMGWVFKSILSPKGGYYIPKELLSKNMGLLEAILWHWGFEYLAILVSSHAILGQETMYVSPIDSRAQIPAELQGQISELFPYVWTNAGKSATKVETHPILLAIDLVVDDLVNNAWRTTAAPEKLTKVFGETRRKLVIAPTIKSELARLLIFNEERIAREKATVGYAKKEIKPI